MARSVLHFGFKFTTIKRHLSCFGFAHNWRPFSENRIDWYDFTSNFAIVSTNQWAGWLTYIVSPPKLWPITVQWLKHVSSKRMTNQWVYIGTDTKFHPTLQPFSARLGQLFSQLCDQSVWLADWAGAKYPQSCNHWTSMQLDLYKLSVLQRCDHLVYV